MRRLTFDHSSIGSLLLTLACSVLLGAAVSASVFQKGKQIVISNLHVIDDDLYVWGEEFTMEGTINGDLTAGAMNSRIYGRVSKAVNVAGLKVLYAGKCDGAYRAFAYEQTIEGTVGGSAVAAGSMIELGKGAVIEHDFWAAGASLHLDGLVRGKVWARAENAFITGQIDGDVEIHGKNLTIRPPAVINGNLTYFSDNPPNIDTSGVTITGTVRHEKPDQSASSDKYSLAQSVIFRISSLIAAFLLGVILLRVFRPYAESTFRKCGTGFATNLATGLVSLGVIVMSMIVLAMAVLAGVVGQALITSGGVGSIFGSALLVFAILALPVSSFFGLTGAITFYLGRVVVALFLGAYVTRRLTPERKLPGYTPLLVGLFTLGVLYSIPYAGVVIYLFVATVGAGALVQGVKNCRAQLKLSANSQ